MANEAIKKKQKNNRVLNVLKLFQGKINTSVFCLDVELANVADDLLPKITPL